LDIIFTDKTGTLTKNEMKLRKIAVDATHILEVDPEDLLRSARAASEVRDLTPFGLLIEAMSVCHTVKPIKQIDG
jgi:P-type E1-E2 ATPase